MLERVPMHSKSICTYFKCSLIPTYCCIPSNRDIFLKYDRAGGSHHGLDHYSAIADCPVIDTITNTPQFNSNQAKENQKVTTNSTNLKTKKNCMPNQKSDETETESNHGGGSMITFFQI